MPKISLFCGESRGLFLNHSNGDSFNVIFTCEAIMFFSRKLTLYFNLCLCNKTLFLVPRGQKTVL